MDDNETIINGANIWGGEGRIKIMQASNVNFSSFVRTKMYCMYFCIWNYGANYVAISIQLTLHTTKATQLKEGKDETNTELMKQAVFQILQYTSNTVFQNFENYAIAFNAATKGGCDEKLC